MRLERGQKTGWGAFIPQLVKGKSCFCYLYLLLPLTLLTP